MADVKVDGVRFFELMLYRPSVGDRLTVSVGSVVVASVGVGCDSLPGGRGVRRAVVELV